MHFLMEEASTPHTVSRPTVTVLLSMVSNRGGQASLCISSPLFLPRPHTCSIKCHVDHVIKTNATYFGKLKTKSVKYIFYIKIKKKTQTNDRKICSVL